VSWWIQLPRSHVRVYGINTGFGPLSGFRISTEELGQHQINLLHHLLVGQGSLFSAAETRAIMLARANLWLAAIPESARN